MVHKDELDYGVVLITRGKFKGRIGYYDDDDYPKHAIVYFSMMLWNLVSYDIPLANLTTPTIDDLLKRRDSIFQQIGIGASSRYNQQGFAELRINLLLELNLIDNVIFDRDYEMQRDYQRDKVGKSVFITHSSKDKECARRLASDLSARGHSPWLDELRIKAGDNIPKKLQQGLKHCDYLLLLNSEHANQSHWVEAEWTSVLMDEADKGKVKIIPIRLDDAEIPQLLKNKKYADFSKDYNQGIREILRAISD